jgi:hypothetical protein
MCIFGKMSQIPPKKTTTSFNSLTTPISTQESTPPPVLRSSSDSGSSSNLSIRKGVSTQRQSRASGRSASKSKRFTTR